MTEPVWEVRWIPLPEGESPGWEPFAAMPNRTEGWVLLLKRLKA